MVHIKHEGIKFQTPEDRFPMDTLDQWDWLTSDDINKALRPCSFSPPKKKKKMKNNSGDDGKHNCQPP